MRKERDNSGGEEMGRREMEDTREGEKVMVEE